jgi:alpha-1,6-mannosyltransferase
MAARARACFFGAGFGSLLIYLEIFFLSRSFVYGQGHRNRPLLFFLALYASAFVLYVITLRVIPLFSWRCRDLALALGFAVLFRVILLCSNPIQEDDFYRYLWDGKVVASSLNPYGVAPSSVIAREESSRAYVDILDADPTFVSILDRVNHPDVPTIYPPVAQGVFALTALAAPGSLLGLRVVFLAFDLALICVILDILRQLNISRAYVLVYAWSPLVVKETINSAHYDVIPAFFLLLAVALLLRGKRVGAHVSLALAVLGKLYPLLLFPFFLWRTKKTDGWPNMLSALGIAATVIVAGYASFWSAGWGLWQGAFAFAGQWQTNSLLFSLLSAGVGNRWVASLAIAVMLGVLAISILRRSALEEARPFLWSLLVMLGALFLCSPVGDPWYFVWIVPFLCVFPLRSGIALSGLLGLYYLSFYFMYQKMPETFQWVIWLEYLPCYGLLLWEWRGVRSVHESSPSPKSTVRLPF